MFAVVTARACKLRYWATLYLMPETKEKIGTGGKGYAGSEIYTIKCYVAIKKWMCNCSLSKVIGNDWIHAIAEQRLVKRQMLNVMAF